MAPPDGIRATSDLTQRRDLLAEVSRLVSYRYDLPETFDGLVLQLRRALDVDLLTLGLPDEQKHTMRLRYSRVSDVVRVDLPVEFPLDDSPSGTAWSTQEIVTVNDVANDRRWPTVMKELLSAGIGTYCSVPLTAGDRRIGALGLGSLKPHAFGDDDLELLRQIAIPVAMAVENELIREYADRYKSEQKRAEAALRDQANLLNLTHDTVFVMDTEGVITYWNRGAEERYGWSAEQALGRVVHDLLKTVFPAPLKQITAGLMHTGRWEGEILHTKKDGTQVTVASRWALQRDEQGVPVAILETNNDITERKRAEQILRQSEAYLAEAERLNHCGSWALDLASDKYVYVSDEDLRIWGFDPQQDLPSKEAVFRRIHPEDRNRWKEKFENSLHEKTDSFDEYRIVLPDGTVRDIYTIRHPVLNSAGDVVQLFGTTMDITERKRAEDELRRSEAQLAHERDRLSLLLEINNLIVSKLEANELFQAVAASMRKHFGNDLTSLWLLNKQTGCLERKYLDFPMGKGFLEKAGVVMFGNLEKEFFRVGKPQIYSEEMVGLPEVIRKAARAESVVSAAIMPLVGADGPLGLLAMSSRKANAFSEADRNLLSQIGTQISLVLDNALAYGRLRASRDDLEDQRLYLESEIRAEYNFEEMVGGSPAWRRVLHQITTVAPTDAGVLLLGETGTGKELIARAIHSRSQRRERTLVKLSCAAVPMGLLESELFGHEKGAFTGALTKQIGRFELANKGTLFLDEVGDIPLEVQTKLLRALQEQEFERLGNPHTIKVDVRVIAATNRDLSQMVKDRTFRQDLYYRLNVFPIVVPPLRERIGDIELLVRFFVAKYAARMRKPIESIPAATMKVLRHYHWPGNIRELEHFVERAVILSPANVLHVPVEELLTGAAGMKIPTLEEGEREQILQALRACGGVIGGPTGAAARLAMNRSTLNSRMRKLGITRADF